MLCETGFKINVMTPNKHLARDLQCSGKVMIICVSPITRCINIVKSISDLSFDTLTKHDLSASTHIELAGIHVLMQCNMERS